MDKKGIAMAGPQLKCKIGLIADTQYADIDDGYNFSHTRKRYYRQALKLTEEAVDTWLAERNPIQCVLQVGDIIDGYCKRDGKSEQSLQTILEPFHRLPCPTFHLVGNHEFYNFLRSQLMKTELHSAIHPSATTPTPGTTLYYQMHVVPGVRVVCLDPYDVSMLSHEPDSAKYLEAQTKLRAVNFNDELNSVAGLSTENARFAKFNGGVGSEQMAWLEEVLSEADRAGDVVIVAGHIPIVRMASDEVCLIWNCEEILGVLRKHGCVQLYVAGHTHHAAHCMHDNINHLTLPGILEVPPGSNGFGTLEVYDDRFQLLGHQGRIVCRTMMFNRKRQTTKVSNTPKKSPCSID